MSLDMSPAGPSLEERVASFLAVNGDALRSGAIDHDDVTDDLVAICEHSSFDRLSIPDREQVIAKATEIYTFTWHASAKRAIPAVEKAFAGFLAAPQVEVNAAAIAYELLYFLYWSGAASIDQQADFGRNVVRPLSDCLVQARRSTPLRPRQEQLRIGYLSQFANPAPSNPIANVCIIVLGLLADNPDYQPILYAWMFHDDATCAALEARGVRVRRFGSGDAPGDRIAKVQQAIDEDIPEILITDMNAALPAVIFERRSAPVQILYQFGMPFWPIRELDAVFEVWRSDPARVAYATSRRYMMEVPFDFGPSSVPVDPERLVAERGRFPQGRLIGMYGRLSKITADYLSVVAGAISDLPDVVVVLGGSGDEAPVRAMLRDLPQNGRFVLVEGFVDGHVWGHMIDVFLDTFPQQGGASCMEMFAKGKPVVSMRSADMPNFVDSRVPAHIADDLAGYSAIVRRLLTDPLAYEEARAATVSFAKSMPTMRDYERRLNRALRDLAPGSLSHRLWKRLSLLFAR